ncbi:MAG: hypothetical protein FJ088_03115, partial [Deltaproteobacteria bacterium]|nr:hypothetical protein [Deltaproteobacteria bacterium]
SNWLGGYEETLLALARGMDFSKCKPGKKSAAVIGYMFDRGEGDHAGNLMELNRIFDSLGVKIETVWLSGQNYEDLLKVKKAGTIISLPYGRKAAKYIADKMKVPLIETCLPFGFEASGKFIRDAAAAFGKEKKAESLINRELSEAVPKLEWVVPFAFQNSRVGFIGDPNHLDGFLDIAGMLGSRVGFAMLTADRGHYENGSANLPENVVFEPGVQTLLRNVGREISENGVDLVVASDVSTKLGNTALMEFGFPSYFSHRFVNRPFLFHKGCLAFVESMYNSIRQFELHNLM